MNTVEWIDLKVTRPICEKASDHCVEVLVWPRTHSGASVYYYPDAFGKNHPAFRRYDTFLRVELFSHFAYLPEGPK